MRLDDLKDAWARHGALLERSLAIDERLLRETLLGKVRRALAPYVVGRAVEVALGVATIALVMPVLVAHSGDPRYVVVAGALAAFAIGMTAATASLLVHGLQLDFGGAVAAIQRDVERLRRAEYRAFKWALLGGVVMWLPAVLVLFEAVTGFEALARVSAPWLVSNLALGLVVLAVGFALSKKYVERPGTNVSPLSRRVIDAVSGRSLQAASAHLAELERFTREEDEAPPAA